MSPGASVPGPAGRDTSMQPHPARRRPRALLALSALCAVVVLAAAMPTGAEWARAGESDVPLEGDGGHWRVRAKINGRLEGVFLLDTGASFCVLSPRFARQLRLPPTDDQVTLKTANGIVRAPIVELASIQIGSVRARGVRAVIQSAVDGPLDGIIGLSFLDRFTYSVVPSRRLLRLR
jgi:clan AA aspartic protease (TIGR02281 family)